GSTFVFNGDVMTDLDLQAMLKFHQEKHSKLTIALTPVEDPTAFGLVETDESGRIHRFVEKPRIDEITTNLINAGTYIIEPELFRYVPPAQHYMFERGLFPVVLQTGDLMYGYPSRAYWTDIGKPQAYIDVHHDILMGKFHYHINGEQIGERIWVQGKVDIHSSARIVGPVVLGDGVRIGPGSQIIGPTVIGANCLIGSNVAIEASVLWESNVIEDEASLRSCVIGKNNTIGSRVQLADGAIVSDNCRIGPENRLERGIRVWPDTVLKERSLTF
ncbi:MAG TPA: NDP-sugar synthase, partial [Roseiflexaceae bacterium]|nr:NDP-sugar synthase [Roseiflexaceae bacterium]